MTTRDADQINASGEPAIAEMVAEEREETLHLEFKTLSSDATLNRDDRKLIAKAVCGFANAEGGLLIIGIETKKTDGVDTAFKKRPVKNLSRLRRLITAALPELLSPQHHGVSLATITDGAGDDQGFLLIDVHPSDDRPHMSVTEKRYFRRGSDGTRVLDHAEIRELMFATREGSLKLDWTIRLGVSSGQQLFAVWIVLVLRNVGRIPVVAPYVRLKEQQPRWAPGAKLNVETRSSADGGYGIYCSRDMLIHLHDEIGIAQYETGLDFRRTGHHEIRAAVAMAKTEGMAHTYAMATWETMHREQPRPAEDTTIEVEGFFGAENVPLKEFKFKIKKANVLELFSQQKGLV